MSASRRLIVDLPETLFAALAEAAAQNGRSLHEEVRLRLRRSIPQEGGARSSGRTDEQLLAPIRARIAGDIGQATGWDDLQSRLRAKGFIFRERGGGLALHRLSDGERICKGSEIGAAYADLIRRFRAPFPGHSHHYMVARVLGGDPAATRPRPSPPDWDDDDPVLIEPW
ncbi:FitA-like ribbon-helix-helix domain-containing protein [Roseicyclus persicicus]|uniref:Antitoxin FitA-like ribbon-helix-helix domain-containing protein n=1 Tax=Roseicyclus persicicus TaxID=2650661 RepID=A0A7X6GYZ8_9RHOB|nr:hypothetical protein [Roseibacterium persicicum]NKX44990.1 hypothetical protein [Roseibacterium persicicum]